MNEREKLLEKFYIALREGRISFSELSTIYVKFLERKEDEDRQQIVDSAVLLSVFEKPKLWQGTKKELKDKLKKVIKNANVF
jgi:hypothetical protein